MLYCSTWCTSFFNVNPKQAAKRNVFNLTLFFNSSTSDSKSESLVSKVAYCMAKEPAEQLLMVVVVRSRQTKTTLLKPILELDQSNFFFFNDFFHFVMSTLLILWSVWYCQDGTRNLLYRHCCQAEIPAHKPQFFTEKGHSIHWK